MGGPSTQDRAFVLHTRRYRENSLLVEALTREHGRVGLVARVGSGRRRPAKEALQAFRPLLVLWQGRGELQSLTHWEATDSWPPLHGERLLSGLYLNELVIRLTGRGEGDPRQPQFAPPNSVLKKSPSALDGLYLALDSARWAIGSALTGAR